jgi:ABC-type branched-subunit amino acid transport system substrate-binding protein
MRDAIRNYFDQVNAKGGVYGRKLELESFDDGVDPVRAIENTKQFLGDHQVFALMGYYGDATTAAALELAAAGKTPIIGTMAGAGVLRQPVNRYMFNVRASSSDEITVVVSQLATLGLTRIAVFYQNDVFGKGNLENFSDALKKFNLAPAVVGSIEPPTSLSSAVDVSGAVQSFAKAKPQAILILTPYKATAELIRQLKKVGTNPQFLALSTVGTDQIAQLLGADSRGIGISQVLPYPWDSTTPVVKEYQGLLQQIEKNPSYSYAGLEGHVIARLVVEALKKAGKDLTREKLVNVLETMDIDLGGYRIRYSPTSHAGSDLVTLTVIGASGRVLR